MYGLSIEHGDPKACRDKNLLSRRLRRSRHTLGGPRAHALSSGFMATIYEVAARAEVSPATVSRVLNGTNVSEDKVARVKQAISELDFSPNRMARSLRRQHSQIIALIIPDIENPFFTSVARGVEDVAQAAGYSVVLCNSDGELSQEAYYLDLAASDNMAGVIWTPASAASTLGRFHSPDRAVVAIDRRPSGRETDAVLVDNHRAGFAATQSLFNQGYSRVACITGPADVETSVLRSEGWREACRAHPDLQPREEYLRYADFRVDGGRAALSALFALDLPPDAVFVANNLMGVGVLQELTARGITTSHYGVAILGDLPYFSFTATGATVIDLPAREIGGVAARLLLERIAGLTDPPRTEVLHSRVLPAQASVISR
jgi:LacI family transcriptional regulator